MASLVEVEDTPFGQHWGILALGEALAEDPSKLGAADRRKLVELRDGLERGTDRYFELSRGLDALP